MINLEIIGLFFIIIAYENKIINIYKLQISILILIETINV